MTITKDQEKIENYRNQAINYYKNELGKLEKIMKYLKEKDFTNCEDCREIDLCIKNRILGNCKLWNI